MTSQITSLTIVYSTVYSGADQRKHQSSASLAFLWGIYQGPVNSPHKWPVTRKMFPFDGVIMTENSHKRHGALNYRWLINTLFCQTKTYESSALFAVCEGKPPMAGGFPSQTANMRFPWHDAIIIVLMSIKAIVLHSKFYSIPMSNKI